MTSERAGWPGALDWACSIVAVALGVSNMFGLRAEGFQWFIWAVGMGGALLLGAALERFLSLQSGEKGKP